MKTHIEKLNYFLFLLLLVSLPFPALFARALYICWGVTWLLECRWLNKPSLQAYAKANNARRIALPIIGTMGMLCIAALSILWADDKVEAWRSMIRLCSFLPLLCIPFWGVNKYYRPTPIMRAIVLSSVASIGVYLFVHFWIQNIHLLRSPLANLPIIPIDWLHLDYLALNIKHRLYYTMWLCLSLPCLLWLYPEYKQRYGAFEARCLVTTLSVILLLGIYWTGSRQGLLNVCVIFAAMAIIHTPTQWKHRHIPYARYITAAAMVCCLCVGLFYFSTYHPRMKDHSVKQWFQFNETHTVTPAYEPRIAIWHSFIEHSNTIPLYGIGIGNAPQFMTDIYKDKDWEGYADRGYSPHNQYLSIWLDLGIIVALCFIAFCLLIPWCFTGKACEWGIYATLIAMSSMLTESLLGKVEGIHFVVITLLIAYLLQAKEPFREAIVAKE